MTDERLEQILKQALAPEISDSEIKISKKAGTNDMMKVMKAVIGIVACLAIVAAVGFSDLLFQSGRADAELAEQADVYAGIPSFTLTAYAAELEQGKDVPVVIDNRQSWALNGNGDTGMVAYNILTSFHCEGEDIDHITYSINQGAFNIVELPEKSIVTNEKVYEGDTWLWGECGGEEDSEGNILTIVKYVTEYTLAGDLQSSNSTWIAVCGEKRDANLFHAIFEDFNNIPGTAEAFTQLLSGVEITCTVYFRDGTSASKIITAQGKRMTYAEAGINCEYDMEITSDTEGAFFTFGLK